jgi:hypothetical protein
VPRSIGLLSDFLPLWASVADTSSRDVLAKVGRHAVTMALLTSY